MLLLFFAILCGILLILLCVSCVRNIRTTRDYASVRQAQKALEDSQKRLNDFALSEIISGHSPSFEYLPDFYRIYDLTFPSQSFMLLVVKVRHHPYGDGPAGLSNAYATVREELCGILSLYTSPYVVETDGVLVCFYSESRVTASPPSPNQKSLRSLLAQHCSACASSLLENHKIDVLIAVGAYDLGGFALHTNYISTKSLLEQAMCSKWSGNVVLDADELTQKTDIELSNAQRQFYNCFVCFKYDAAAEHLFHMVQLRIRDYYDSFTEAREIVAKQLRFCTDMLELPLNVKLPVDDAHTISIRDLMLSADEATLQQNLTVYFHSLSLYVQGGNTQAAPTMEQVYRYIGSHYSDPTISVSSISERFHLNVSYLSRQFKQEYGYGVLEFIHRTRISHAKDLMAAGKSAADVFSAVGYTSRRAFDSAFARYESITPKTYQDQLHSASPAQ